MAAHTVAAGDVGKYEIALAASTEDTVTFTSRSIGTIDIVHHYGTKPLYFCIGATTATAKGAHCHMVMPGNSVQYVNPSNAVTVVRIISEAAATVSVANGR